MRSTRVRASSRVDESFHEGVTDDGLRVHVIPRPGYQKKFAIFVTGDSDFVPLLESLQHRGKRVMVVATQQNVAVRTRLAPRLIVRPLPVLAAP